MIIVSQNFDAIIDSKNAPSFYINGKVDEYGYRLVTPILDSFIVLGEYKEKSQAQKAIRDLFNALTSEELTGQQSYQIE